MECIGSTKYLVNNIPADSPALLKPLYSDIDRIKDTLHCAEPFFKKVHTEWWKKFFIEKEEEGV